MRLASFLLSLVLVSLALALQLEAFRDNDPIAARAALLLLMCTVALVLLTGYRLNLDLRTQEVRVRRSPRRHRPGQAYRMPMDQRVVSTVLAGDLLDPGEVDEAGCPVVLVPAGTLLTHRHLLAAMFCGIESCEVYLLHERVEYLHHAPRTAENQQELDQLEQWLVDYVEERVNA